MNPSMNSSMPRAKIILCLLAVFFSSSLQALVFDSDAEKNWVEVEAQLPAFPEADNLLPFTVGSVFNTQYLIDANALSVASDEVIRYTLVIISSAGAQNISYEAMRCATGERRVYAFGRADKTWSKPKKNDWSKIPSGTNSHYAELYANYFCTIDAPLIRSAEDARRVLRRGGALSGGRR